MPFAFKLFRRLAHSRALVAALTATALVACAGGDGSPTAPAASDPAARTPHSSSGTVASISISPSSATGSLGQSAQFTATAYNSNGSALTGQSFAWTTSDSTVVEVNTTGYATAIGVGNATLIATDGSIKGTAPLTVTGDAAAAITVSPASASGAVGSTDQFAATLTDASGAVLTGRRVLWASSNAAVARVDPTGLATGVAAGSATIWAFSEGQSATASVTVTGTTVTAPGTVADLAVSGTTDSTATLLFTQVTNGAGAPASYEVRYATGTLSWGSAGDVTAGTCATPLAGTAIGSKLTCTASGLAASTAYQFQVVAFRGTLNSNAVFGSLSNVASGTTAAVPSSTTVASVAVSPSSASGTVGQSAQFTATAYNSSGTALPEQTFTWSSTNTAVVTVTASGYATAVGAGSASIVAADGSVKGQASVSVSGGTTTGAPASVTVSPSSASVSVGSSQQFTATVYDAIGNALSGQTLSWTSSNPAIATVGNRTGLETTLLTGTTTITATDGSVSGTATLTVSVLPPPPSSGTWPEEPAGFTDMTDNPFNSLTAAGWQIIWNTSGYGTIATDPTAPASPSSVFQVKYPVGFAGGSAPATEEFDHPAYTDVYAGFWWKPSNPWENHPSSNVNKIAFWYTATSGSNFDIQMYGPAPYYLHIVTEFPAGQVRLKPNVTPVAVTLGQWHRIEIHARYASTPGGSNGMIEWWLDGVLQGQYNNVQTPADAGFTTFYFSPTWGGIGDTKTETDYYWYDQVHLSHN